MNSKPVPGSGIDQDARPITPVRDAVLDDAIVEAPVTSSEWVHRFGVQTTKLTFNRVLADCGFGDDDFDAFADTLSTDLQRHLGTGLFDYYRDHEPTGTSCAKSTASSSSSSHGRLMQECERRLALHLRVCQARRDFLKRGSRATFGLLTVPETVLILDTSGLTSYTVEFLKASLMTLVREQFSQLKLVNAILCGRHPDSSEPDLFSGRAVSPSTSQLDDLCAWIRVKVRLDAASSKPSPPALAPALRAAFADERIQSVILVSHSAPGESADTLVTQVLETNSRRTLPVHVVAYNPPFTSEASEFHDKLTRATRASLKIVAPAANIPSAASSISTSVRSSMPILSADSEDQIVAGELALARESLERLRRFRKSLAKKRAGRCTSVVNSGCTARITTPHHGDPWLAIHGLTSRHLDIASHLKPIAFKHCPGAHFCHHLDMVHYVFPDGRTRHVRFTRALGDAYAIQIQGAIDLYTERVAWLARGSRAIFGELPKTDSASSSASSSSRSTTSSVVVIVDTSLSMQPRLAVLKDNLMRLLREQIAGQRAFNFVQCSTEATPFRPAVVQPTPSAIDAAAAWIRALHADGSSNVDAALQLALRDVGAHTIFFITDGRPDQPEAYLLERVTETIRARGPHAPVTINTISFHMSDPDANQFPRDLAALTSTGRFFQVSRADLPYTRDAQTGAVEITQLSLDARVRAVQEEILLAQDYLRVARELCDQCEGKGPAATARAEQRRKAEHKARLGMSDSRLLELRAGPRWHHMSSSRPGDAQWEAQQRSMAKIETVKLREFAARRASQRAKLGPTQRAAMEKEDARRLAERTEELESRLRGTTAQSLVTSVRATPEQQKKAGKAQIRKMNKMTKGEPQHIRPERVCSTHDWLNGGASLEQRKLSIFDVFNSMVVRHSPKYVKMLGKEVHARYCEHVYDTYQFVDGDMEHINPQAAHIQQYLLDVNEAVELYRQRLVWLQRLPRSLLGVVAAESVVIAVELSPRTRDHADLIVKALQLQLKELVQRSALVDLVLFDECGMHALFGRQEPLDDEERAAEARSFVDELDWGKFADGRLRVEQEQHDGDGTAIISEVLRVICARGGADDTGGDTVDVVHVLMSSAVDAPADALVVSARDGETPTRVHTVAFNTDDDTHAVLRNVSLVTGGHHLRCDVMDESLKVESDDTRLLEREMARADEYKKRANEFVRAPVHPERSSVPIWQPSRARPGVPKEEDNPPPRLLELRAKLSATRRTVSQTSRPASAAPSTSTSSIAKGKTTGARSGVMEQRPNTPVLRGLASQLRASASQPLLRHASASFAARRPGQPMNEPKVHGRSIVGHSAVACSSDDGYFYGASVESWLGRDGRFLVSFTSERVKPSDSDGDDGYDTADGCEDEHTRNERRQRENRRRQVDPDRLFPERSAVRGEALAPGDFVLYPMATRRTENTFVPCMVVAGDSDGESAGEVALEPVHTHQTTVVEADARAIVLLRDTYVDVCSGIYVQALRLLRCVHSTKLTRREAALIPSAETVAAMRAHLVHLDVDVEGLERTVNTSCDDGYTVVGGTSEVSTLLRTSQLLDEERELRFGDMVYVLDRQTGRYFVGKVGSDELDEEGEEGSDVEVSRGLHDRFTIELCDGGRLRGVARDDVFSVDDDAGALVEDGDYVLVRRVDRACGASEDDIDATSDSLEWVMEPARVVAKRVTVEEDDEEDEEENGTGLGDDGLGRIETEEFAVRCSWDDHEWRWCRREHLFLLTQPLHDDMLRYMRYLDTARRKRAAAKKKKKRESAQRKKERETVASSLMRRLLENEGGAASERKVLLTQRIASEHYHERRPSRREAQREHNESTHTERMVVVVRDPSPVTPPSPEPEPPLVLSTTELRDSVQWKHTDERRSRACKAREQDLVEAEHLLDQRACVADSVR